MNVSTNIENKKKWILLCLILCLGVFLRFYGLTNQSLWVDELVSVRTAEKGFAGIINEVSRGYDCSPPLYYFILHIWMMVLGTGELAVRMLSAILGILLIPAIYYVGSSLFSRKAGLISAFLTAIGEFHIKYSQEARMYTMLALLGLFSTYFLYRALTTDRKSSWAGYIIFTILTIYTHNYGLFIATSGVVFAVIFFVTQKNKCWKFLISLSVIALTYIPCFLLFLTKQYVSPSLDSWLPNMRPFLAFHTFLAFCGLSLGTFALHHIPTIAIGVIIFLFFFAAGIFSMKRHKKVFIPYIKTNMNLILILCYLFVTLAIPMLISIKKPIFMPDRYSISAWPAFFLILGLGLSKIKNKYILIIPLILITFVSSVSLYWYYFISVKSCDRTIAAYIDSRAGKNDLIVFAPHWLGLPINYYLHISLKQVGYPGRSHKELIIDTEPSNRKPADMFSIIKSRMGNARGKIFLVSRTNNTNQDVENLKSVYNNNLNKFESEMQTVKNFFDNKLNKLEDVTYDMDFDSINVAVYYNNLL